MVVKVFRQLWKVVEGGHGRLWKVVEGGGMSWGKNAIFLVLLFKEISL